MRSVDLTARARIRDAGVALIGRLGVAGTSLRAVAAAAGVSPALVVHHFGSKDGLREACEEHILAVFTAEVDRLGETDASGLGALLDRRAEFLPVQAYLRRTLHDGGPFADRVVAHLVAVTRAYLERAVASGTVRPTTDEAGRAAALVAMSLGVQMLAAQLAPPGTPPDEQPLAAADRLALPMMELLTHGLYADDSMLQAYRSLREQP